MAEVSVPTDEAGLPVASDGLVVCVLGSSSKGNSTLMSYHGSTILIDAGLPKRYIIDTMRRIGIPPSGLQAIFVTHEHTDHIQSVGPLGATFSVPIYISDDSFFACRERLGDYHSKHTLEPGEQIEVGPFTVDPFHIPHDALSNMGFRIEAGERSVGVATDIGWLENTIVDKLKGCEVLVLESNYDPGMLKTGPYPRQLKQRIMSNRGHISNLESAKALELMITERTRHVLLAHLSEINNEPLIAAETVHSYLKDKGVEGPLIHLTYPMTPSVRIHIR